jgi:hypothetical protein
MRDMIAAGAAWLDGQRREHMAVPVTYRPAAGLFAVTVPATIGLSRYETVDAAGQLLRYESRDYFISTADMQAEPRRGDVITELVDGNAQTYLVAGPPGGGNVWSWADRGQRVRRIHTHKIGQD